MPSLRRLVGVRGAWGHDGVIRVVRVNGGGCARRGSRVTVVKKKGGDSDPTDEDEKMTGGGCHTEQQLHPLVLDVAL